MNDWYVHVHDYTTVLLSCFLAARLNNSRSFGLHTHTHRGYGPVWFIVYVYFIVTHTQWPWQISKSILWLVDGHMSHERGVILDFHIEKGLAPGPHLTRLRLIYSNYLIVCVYVKPAAFTLCLQTKETHVANCQTNKRLRCLLLSILWELINNAGDCTNPNIGESCCGGWGGGGQALTVDI